MHKRKLKDDIHTKGMSCAECHTDHRLVRSKIRLHFKPKPRKGGLPKKMFNLNKLQSAKVKADFQFHNSDWPEDTSPETLWDQMKSAILQISEEVLGFTTKNKDWFDENNQEIQELLAKKISSHQAHLAKPSCPVIRLPSVSFAASPSASFERSKMSVEPISQRELSNAQL